MTWPGVRREGPLADSSRHPMERVSMHLPLQFLNTSKLRALLLIWLCVFQLPRALLGAETDDPPLPDRLPVHVNGHLGFIDLSGKLLFMTEFKDYGDGLGYEPFWSEGFLWVDDNFIGFDGKPLSPQPLAPFDWMHIPEPPFQDGRVHVSTGSGSNTLYRIIDTSGRTIFSSPTRYGEFGFEEGLHPVPLAGGYGYIDTNGTVAIAGPYEQARSFRAGLAWVRDHGKWGAIDRTGKYAVRPNYEDAHYAGFCEGHAWVRNSRGWGLVDTFGRQRIKPQFDEVGRIRGGLTCVKRGERWGVVDSKGILRVPLRYDRVEPIFRTDSLWDVQDDVKHGIVTSDGVEALPVEYDEIGGFRDSSGLARVTKGGLHGLVDKTGGLALSPVYDSISPDFKEGLAPFCLNGKWGYMDRAFRIVIAPQFMPKNDVGWGFSCGRSRFRDDEGRYGYIDTSGQIVIAPRYDDAEYRFQHGLAPVTIGKYPAVQKHGVIDTRGTLVVPLEYGSARVVRPGIVRLSIGRRYGYMRPPGTWIWEPSE